MKPTHTMVNCWFCNQDTLVPYGNRNCWDCPHCEQYNGFQENGDYNKPIPAQYMEHLNHVVSSTPSLREPVQPQQWVSSQVLLCKRCNHHQTTKIKQLAAFAPREEGRYDEEIEVYRHHLEQMYKLCRPCQAAVEYYIKHQNRQLRALLLSHQFKRREADQAHMQVRAGSHGAYFLGDSTGLFPSSPSLAVPCPSVGGSSPSLFLPTPPGLLPLTNQQLFRTPRRVSPSSLPGRLSRALSLGTIPSLTRA
ncbi:PREDICTED: transmembrane protein 201-like, partial [Galeopterus variegatus]|uniref:Transmembrane protein 201-like n=1 Tax=Galeopterus variegatus TaxID=482537 RepID=A0ABM0Q2S3_GALVR